MATRVYFPEAQPADVSPTISATDWEHINTLRRALKLGSPDDSALSTVAYTPDAADDLTDRDSHHRQYVSPPLMAQTISGNVTAQFQCLETAANDNLHLSVKIYVVDLAGTTEKETLLAITRGASEANTTIRNLSLGSTALASATLEYQDRIVIEIGLGGSITSGTGGTIGHNGSIRWGCAATSGDLPVNETETGATFRPWLEFTDDIFVDEGAPLNVIYRPRLYRYL